MARLLKRIDQNIVSLERRRRFYMTDERKREARRKFLLGGIVVRAGLAEADRAFLLGALLEAGRISPGADAYERLKALGETAFRTPASTARNPISCKDDE